MGKIILSTNSTLDGVVEDPDGSEGSQAGGWFRSASAADLDAWARFSLEESLGASALLLGRRSDEWFAQRWTTRTGERADRLNALPTYVVSSTLDRPSWTNATLLAGDPVTAVAELKRTVAGDILVYASYELGRTLLEHDLVDEVRLVVFPVVVGQGRRLLGGLAARKPLRLTGIRTIGDQLALLTYEPVGPESSVR